MPRAINTGMVIAFLSSLFAGLVFVLSGFNPLVFFVLAIALIFFILARYLSTEAVIKGILFVAFLVPFQYAPKLLLITDEKLLKLINFLNPLTFLAGILFLKMVGRVFRRIHHKVPLNLEKVDVFYICFIFFSLISTIHARSKLGALNWIFYSVITGFTIYKVLSVYSLGSIKKVLTFLQAVATISAIYGIAEYFLGYSLIMGPFQERLTSLLGHPLYSGLMYAAVLPIGFALYMDTKKVRYLVSMFVLAIAVVLTFARGSWLAVIFGLTAMLSFYPFKTNLKLIFFGATLAVAVVMVPFFRESVAARLTSNETKGYSSFDIRKRSIPLAFGIIRESPWLGVGPFNASRYQYEYAYSRNMRKVGSFENTYLELLVDLGVVGFACFAGIIMMGIFRTFFIRIKESPQRIYQAAFSASLVIVLINMATFNFDANRLFHFVLWFYLSLGLNRLEA